MNLVRLSKSYLKLLFYRACALALFLKSGLKRKSIIVLYLYADTEKYPDTFAKLRNILNSVFFVNFVFIKIDNFNENKALTRPGKNIFDIGGDNQFWEFSGWKKGLIFLKEQLLTADHVLFVNDSFLNLSHMGYDFSFYKRKLNPFEVYNIKNSVLAILDRHERTEKIYDIDVSSWIRSNLFLVPYQHAIKLDFVYFEEKELNQILPLKFDQRIFNDTDIVNDNLKIFLESWIKEKWQFSIDLTPESWPFIRMKIVSILNERLLYNQIRQFKTEIIDIKY